MEDVYTGEKMELTIEASVAVWMEPFVSAHVKYPEQSEWRYWDNSCLCSINSCCYISTAAVVATIAAVAAVAAAAAAAAATAAAAAVVAAVDE